MNFGTLHEKSSDEMIITALCLLYFVIGDTVDPEEHIVHLNGINKMLAVRKGVQNLGMRGIAKNWLGVCHGPWSIGYIEGGF